MKKKRIRLYLFLCIVVSLVGVPGIWAAAFHDVPLSDGNLVREIERAYATGAIKGFGGFKHYTTEDLINSYLASPNDFLLNRLRKDLEDYEKPSLPFFIEPISNIEVGFYQFHTDVPNKEIYCVENQDGLCVADGFNLVSTFTGRARLHSNVVLQYEARAQLGEHKQKLSLQRLYGKYTLGPFEFTAGKESLWLGHGVHGSFLLSTNAEPFWLVKLTTSDFHIPYLELLGKFKYMFFHGWLNDFNMLGHRLGWKPFDILEFGATQTVTYRRDKGYTILDWPKLLFSSEENVPGAEYNNDQRASLDVALYMPFLKKLPYLEGGKIYAEYAGEDIYAWWQEEDGTWYGPFGFEFLGGGLLIGGFFTTGSTDLRIEWSENYRSYPLFWDWYCNNALSKQMGQCIPYASKGETWYRNIRFTNGDAIAGHHMGPEAEDFYIELGRWFGKNKNLRINVFYDKEKHHLFTKIDQFHIYKTTPEIRHQYGLSGLYIYKKYEISLGVLYSRYENVDTNPDPLIINDSTIARGKDVSEWVVSVGFRYVW